MKRNLCASMLVLCMITTAAAQPSPSMPDDASIRQHRMGALHIMAAPGATVRVAQQRHEFWFGTSIANEAFNGRMTAADVARYQAVLLENFNSGVTENALKWHSMEVRRGVVNYATTDAILAWADAHHLPLRGHNIYWGVPEWVQPWQKSLGNDELRSVLQARAFDIAERYRGRFAEYDLNNEMIHGNFYADRLGPRITLEMTQWIHAKDPAAKLFLNDYDILTGRRLDDYVAHIRELLAMGVPIAGIGVQGHLHGDSFKAADVRHALDVLAQFKLPIRVTEFNFPGQRSRFYEKRDLAITPEEEEAKARAIVEYYRICFAHPAVSGILMWGFWEGANWIPQSSLYRRDWSPTPAALAYRELIFNTWWTRAEVTADAHGRAEVPAYFGTHRVSVGDQAVTVELRQADGSARVTLK